MNVSDEDLKTLPGLAGLEPDEIPMTIESFAKGGFLDQYDNTVVLFYDAKAELGQYGKDGDPFPCVALYFQTSDGKSHREEIKNGNIKNSKPHPDGTRFVLVSGKRQQADNSSWSKFIAELHQKGFNTGQLAPPPAGRRLVAMQGLWAKLAVRTDEYIDKKEKDPKKAKKSYSYLGVAEVFATPQWAPMPIQPVEQKSTRAAVDSAPQNTVNIGGGAAQVAGMPVQTPQTIPPVSSYAPMVAPGSNGGGDKFNDSLRKVAQTIIASAGKPIPQTMIGLGLQQMFQGSHPLSGMLAGFPELVAEQPRALQTVFGPTWPIENAQAGGWVAKDANVWVG